MARRVYRRLVGGDTIQSLQVQKPLDELQLRPRNLWRYFFPELLRDATQLLFVRKNPPNFFFCSSTPGMKKKYFKTEIAHSEHSSECPAQSRYALFLSFLQRRLTFSRWATPVSFPPACGNLLQPSSLGIDDALFFFWEFLDFFF